MRLSHSDLKSAQWYHAVFSCSKTIWKYHKSRKNVLCKKGGYSGLLQACATSRRVLVVMNTCNKYPRSVNTSIHSVKGDKQQEMQ